MQIQTDQSQKEQKPHGTKAFPFLVSREILSRYESGSFLWHWHPEIELTLVTSGQMLYQINNHSFHLREGEALFGNTSTLHSGSMYLNHDCKYTSITFDARLLYGSENSILYQSYIKPILQNYSLSGIHFDGSLPWHTEVLQTLHAVLNARETASAGWELDVTRELLHFWKLLYLHADTTDALSKTDRRNYERIRNILAYIEANYSSNLTLEDIADHIHLCKSECCRMFKRCMRQSLFDFILEYRIEQSLAWLSDTGNSIQAVSEKVGFNDANYFSRVFRKYRGCSPSAYRKELHS